MKNSIISTTFAALLAVTSTANADENKLFHGSFAGIEAGYLDAQNDVNGFYYGANLGFRAQSETGLVYGIEGTIGQTNLNNAVDVDYQFSIMPTLGWALGDEKRNLVSVGAGYAKLKASISGPNYSRSNDDFAAFVGFERAIGESLSLRTRVTTYGFDDFLATAGIGFRF
tara:strand:- start:748 stop:1257 length:510 start_codon:yes stop_codon:yes gene_type:complete